MYTFPTECKENIKTKDRCVRALQNLRQVEYDIRASYFKRKLNKEKDPIERMNDNQKCFFINTKNLKLNSCKIRPPNI